MNKKIGFTMIFSMSLIGIIIISSLFTFGGTGVTNDMESIDSTQATQIYSVRMYLTLKGDTQGDITGSVTEAGREDSIQVLAYSHSVISPRDAASGLPTGKRQHYPLYITKQIDKSTPLLYNLLVNNENINEWKLSFYRLGKSGIDYEFYTIELLNAAVASYNVQASENGATERIGFTYQKITWTWVDGGIIAYDDWESPNV